MDNNTGEFAFLDNYYTFVQYIKNLIKITIC